MELHQVKIESEKEMNNNNYILKLNNEKINNNKKEKINFEAKKNNIITNVNKSNISSSAVLNEKIKNLEKSHFETIKKIEIEINKAPNRLSKDSSHSRKYETEKSVEKKSIKSGSNECYKKIKLSPLLKFNRNKSSSPSNSNIRSNSNEYKYLNFLKNETFEEKNKSKRKKTTKSSSITSDKLNKKVNSDKNIFDSETKKSDGLKNKMKEKKKNESLVNFFISYENYKINNFDYLHSSTPHSFMFRHTHKMNKIQGRKDLDINSEISRKKNKRKSKEIYTPIHKRKYKLNTSSSKYESDIGNKHPSFYNFLHHPKESIDKHLIEMKNEPSSMRKIQKRLKGTIIENMKKELNEYENIEIKNAFEKLVTKVYKEESENVKDEKKSGLESDLIIKKSIYKINKRGILKSKSIYRILQKKNLIYDSLEDDEILESEIIDNFYFKPDSIFLYIIDGFIFLFSFLNLFYLPFYLSNNIFFNENYYIIHEVLFYFIDFLYIIDLVINFFRAYYNFDEYLIKDNNKICLNYIKSWLIPDFITSIPIFFYLKIYEKHHIRSSIFNNISRYDFKLNNYHYLFTFIKLLKIFKVLHQNIFFSKIVELLSKNDLIFNWGSIFMRMFIFIAILNLWACLFIFIGRNRYPNWIINLNISPLNFKNIYIASIYYIISTITTVGYGDIKFENLIEKIFQIIIIIIGTFIYSWLISSASNYIKKMQEKTISYEKRLEILDNIKLENPNLSEKLYTKILRLLNYKKYYESLDKNIILNSLPFSLRNTLIIEMYKPVINNFIFFKNFHNSNFIVQVVLSLKPIISIRGDILIKEGDFIEDILFVKKGKLALEICIDLENPEESIKKYSNEDYIKIYPEYKNIFKNNNSSIKRDESLIKINENGKSTPSNHNNNNKRNRNLLIKNETNKKKEKNLKFIKVLDVRKNEHFGDVLMFLNKRSPLYVITRTKRTELFLLKKMDAVNISTNFPNIWKRINKKSLFNMQQTENLIQKILLIFCNLNGIIIGPKKRKKRRLSVEQDFIKTIIDYKKMSFSEVLKKNKKKINTLKIEENKSKKINCLNETCISKDNININRNKISGSIIYEKENGKNNTSSNYTCKTNKSQKIHKLEFSKKKGLFLSMGEETKEEGQNLVENKIKNETKKGYNSNEENTISKLNRSNSLFDYNDKSTSPLNLLNCDNKNIKKYFSNSFFGKSKEFAENEINMGKKNELILKSTFENKIMKKNEFNNKINENSRTLEKKFICQNFSSKFSSSKIEQNDNNNDSDNDKINDEIYPNENFFLKTYGNTNLQNKHSENQDFYLDSTIKNSNINQEDLFPSKINRITNQSKNLENNNNIQKDKEKIFYFLKSSNTLEIEIKASYENINKLTSNRYIRDKEFRSKIQKMIFDNLNSYSSVKNKNKIKLNTKNNNLRPLLYINIKKDEADNKKEFDTEPEEKKLNSVKLRPRNEKRPPKSISKFGLLSDIQNNRYLKSYKEQIKFSRSLSHINDNEKSNIQKKTNIIESNNNLSLKNNISLTSVNLENIQKSRKPSNDIVINKEKKNMKNMLNKISINIRKNSQNINNPNEFYAGLFNIIMKKEKENSLIKKTISKEKKK